MKLTVVLKDGEYIEYDTLVYEISPHGELDILGEDEVVLATFNSTSWSHVYLEKEDEEEWPASVLTPQEEPGQEGPTPLGGDIDGFKLGYQIKIPGADMETPPPPDM